MTEQNIVTKVSELPAVKLGLTKQVIGKLKKKFPVDNIPDPSTKDGMLEIKGVLRELVPYRTGVEKARKELVAGAVAWQKKVNSEAKELTSELLKIEGPYRDAKKAEEERVAREKAEAERLENERIERIEADIEKIYGMADGLLGAGVSVLEQRFDDLSGMDITEDQYMEFMEAAELAKTQTLKQIDMALQNARQLEEQRLAMEKQMAELEEQKRALQAQQEEIKKQSDLEPVKEAGAKESEDNPVVHAVDMLKVPGLKDGIIGQFFKESLFEDGGKGHFDSMIAYKTIGYDGVEYTVVVLECMSKHVDFILDALNSQLEG